MFVGQIEHLFAREAASVQNATRTVAPAESARAGAG